MATGHPEIEQQFAAFTGVASRPGWRPTREVIDSEVPALVESLAQIREASPAVAGSLFVLEYARRLSWPVLAAHLRDGAWLDPGRHNVHLAADPGPPRIGFAQAASTDGPRGTGEVVGALVHHLDHLVEAVRRTTRVGRRTLWGNVAVAVAQAFMALSWASPGRNRFAERAERGLEGNDRLRGLVTVDAVHHDGEDWMVVWRRTCCLAFRCDSAGPEPRYCGTCPVLGRSEKEAGFRRAATRYVRMTTPR